MDGHGLPELEPVVVDRGNPGVWVDRKIFGSLATAVAEMHRDVLVVEPELVGHPKHAIGPRSGHPIDLQIAHSALPCKMAIDRISGKRWPARTKFVPATLPPRASRFGCFGAIEIAVLAGIRHRKRCDERHG